MDHFKDFTFKKNSASLSLCKEKIKTSVHIFQISLFSSPLPANEGGHFRPTRERTSGQRGSALPANEGGLLRQAELSTKIEFTRMASSNLLRFTAISATATSGREREQKERR